MAAILLLNGPNLHALGRREPHIYGAETLDDIVQHLENKAQHAGHVLVPFQSNHEGALIDRLYQAQQDQVSWAIINPGALGHTSIALRDALLATALPFIEVHLSNIYQRESYRKTSLLADMASGVIIGLGALGYQLALQAICQNLQPTQAGTADI
jgi:3-dehydroquinate dehydratase-2